MLKLRDIMTTDIVYANPEMTLRQAMQLLSEKHISGAPVVQGGRVVGIFSSTDLLTFVGDLDAPQPSVSFRGHRRPLEEVTVSDVMTREVQSLGPDCSVEVAASLMRRSQIHRVLVMQDRRLLGVVTTTDLARTVAERRIRISNQVA
jgi:CBS domain-containing protein